MSEARFQIGDRVHFTTTQRKARGPGKITWKDNGLPFRDIAFMRDTVPGDLGYPKVSRRWTHRTEHFDHGVIVGMRYLHDYEIDYGGYDESSSARSIRGTSRRAWLVAYDLHRQPALVLDEHVEGLLTAEPEVLFA